MIFPFLIHTDSAYQQFLGKLGLNPLLKLFSIFFLLLIFSACEEIPDGVIEQTKVYNKVKSISAPANFSFSQTDSILTTSIEFESSKYISKVWMKIKSENGSVTVNSSLQMLDNGNLAVNGDQKADDNIFSARVGIGKKYSNGKYFIEYYVEDNVKLSPENVTKVAVHFFNFNNNQVSYSPLISNLTIPNLVNRGESFVFTLKVEDQNGLGDISQVYFKLFRPDGTLADPQNGLGYFLMVDDGNLDVFGDQTAGDGIYSFKNLFSSTAQTGQWKFEFQAKDKSANLSNVIIHNMNVN
ncbi:MAG: hypothetical protein RDU14_08315 [Melioribacteraceae bacterium]|nr:hypothetical protein [Melioribacteraceae bacterium]